MIYFCADDYGLNDISSSRIRHCIDKGLLNKVSVFPNFNTVDLNTLQQNKDVLISLHLNLVEGKCMANADTVKLIADENGVFKHTFGGLFKLNLFKRKPFEEELYKEIKAQVLYWKSILPENVGFCIDSHQHTHMIPAVFNALIKVLKDEQISVKYMRIPVEPILPYIKTPSLYFTYSIVNLIKQWLINFLWAINKKAIKGFNIPTAYFFGILFSGKMDAERVSKVLPKYLKLAKKHNKDVEVLFHPGYLNKNELSTEHINFENFYLSKNRKTEFNSALNLTERSVQ